MLFLLECIQTLAFVNPFAGEKDEIEGNIISRMGWTENLQETNSRFTKEFNQVLHWVREERGFFSWERIINFAQFYGPSKGILGIFFFHEIIDDLDF